jgi:hypothetical protein
MTTGPAADAAADASKIEPEFGEGLEETLALLDHNTLAGMRGLYRDLSAEIERRRQAEDKIAERLKDLGQELKRVLPTLRTEIDQEVTESLAERDADGDPEAAALLDVLAEFLNMVTPGMKGLDLHRGATAVDADVSTTTPGRIREIYARRNRTIRLRAGAVRARRRRLRDGRLADRGTGAGRGSVRSLGG